jgi:hypothetical protein
MTNDKEGVPPPTAPAAGGEDGAPALPWYVLRPSSKRVCRSAAKALPPPPPPTPACLIDGDTTRLEEDEEEAASPAPPAGRGEVTVGEDGDRRWREWGRVRADVDSTLSGESPPAPPAPGVLSAGEANAERAPGVLAAPAPAAAEATGGRGGLPSDADPPPPPLPAFAMLLDRGESTDDSAAEPAAAAGAAPPSAGAFRRTEAGGLKNAEPREAAEAVVEGRNGAAFSGAKPRSAEPARAASSSS